MDKCVFKSGKTVNSLSGIEPKNGENNFFFHKYSIDLAAFPECTSTNSRIYSLFYLIFFFCLKRCLHYGKLISTCLVSTSKTFLVWFKRCFFEIGTWLIFDSCNAHVSKRAVLPIFFYSHIKIFTAF